MTNINDALRAKFAEAVAGGQDLLDLGVFDLFVEVVQLGPDENGKPCAFLKIGMRDKATLELQLIAGEIALQRGQNVTVGHIKEMFRVSVRPAK